MTFSSTDALPGSIAPATTYFVVQVSADQNTFQISGTQGGAPISMTDAGTGTHAIVSPPWRKSDRNSAIVEASIQGAGGSGGVANRTSNTGTATGGGAGGYAWLRRHAESLPDELETVIGAGGIVPDSGNAGRQGANTYLGSPLSPVAYATRWRWRGGLGNDCHAARCAGWNRRERRPERAR
ncbi:hypothetical protein BJG93_24450 [Paraburkholderia sprentiae WSM5005]|uniref:Uncharacterized protein n=1 Tax=Paraburkholderia sprentiae WSM5005 TaxID=754502 RepID=A0A1I9YQL4_9BURK|nr:hypothetical protein [Paraburkholderia sprentiae]APA88503.1 hypothetical protein BJG93_24450 [Paraburkholderia sprentiae WSM5005]